MWLEIGGRIDNILIIALLWSTRIIWRVLDTWENLLSCRLQWKLSANAGVKNSPGFCISLFDWQSWFTGPRCILAGRVPWYTDQVRCVLFFYGCRSRPPDTGAGEAQNSFLAKIDTLWLTEGRPSRLSFAPAGLGLSPRSWCALFWEMPTRPKTFLKPPGVWGLRPCALFPH